MAASPAQSVLIHTVNVVKKIKPNNHGQAADAVHHTLHFALDGRQEDWEQMTDDEDDVDCGGCGGGNGGDVRPSSSSPPGTMVNGNGAALTTDEGIAVRRGFVANPITAQRENRPYISYQHDDRTRTLVIPHPATIPDPLRSDPCGPESRDAHDVTAKFHLGGLVSDPDEAVRWIEDGLQRLRINTGLVTIDTLVLSFEGISQRWNGLGTKGQEGKMSEEEAGRMAIDVENVGRVWSSISQSPFVQSLGLAGLPLPFLQSLFPAQRQSTPFNVPSAYRLPRVIAMGTQAGDACSITSNEELLRWCHSWEENGSEAVLALSHSDPEVILPRQAFSSVLEEFQDRLPALAGVPKAKAEDFDPKWCLRYTVLIRDRGVLADKGFLVSAEVKQQQ